MPPEPGRDHVRDVTPCDRGIGDGVLQHPLGHLRQPESRGLDGAADELVVSIDEHGLRVGRSDVEAGGEGHDAFPVDAVGARAARM